jgi:PAS domain S-box-containing protein
VWHILGYERDSLIGRSIWEFVHPDDKVRTRAVMDDLLDKKILYFTDTNFFCNRWRKSNGDYAKLTWRFSMYDDNEKQSIGFATDVTELGTDNPFTVGLVQKAVNMTVDGIVITDMRLPDRPIVFVNTAFARITGYEKQEILGKNHRFLQGEPHQQACNTLQHALQNSETCEVLLKNVRKDGVHFFNHLLVTPVIEHGITTNYIEISRDATELVNRGVIAWDKNLPTGFGPQPTNKYEQ